MSSDVDENLDSEIDVEFSEILSLIEQKTLCYIDSMEKDAVVQDDLSMVVHDAVTIAVFVEKSLRKHIKCSTCTENINTMESYHDISLVKCKDFSGLGGGLIKPKKDIVLICQIAEKVLASFECEDRLRNDNFYIDLMKMSFQKLPNGVFGKIFGDSNPAHLFNCPYNRDHLIKHCLNMYFTIKLFHITKRMTEKQKEILLRQKCNKLVLFKGQ